MESKKNIPLQTERTLASCALKVQRVYKNQNFLSRKKLTNAHVVKQKQ